ncbi:hypothetical protein [Siphonobacter sp. SORGH_AS_1065]|uniref:hypothetical protein n=1 Tax=Siphonobacter sp. SORGH_AS_1065 TaxID=3041795 RepID=UPI002780E51D|nr:hypothetical protein [Siphonobacter sp. SORGH_AS_1065]MDQ1090385.1 xanthine/CO dehydrogenase XdhC/CoxF family maturation factor [Siphonobacter sp. SORGH_AS_1065]
MHVTPDLLKRYYQGLATFAEQQAVEDWLREEHAFVDVPESYIRSATEETEIRKRLWQKIFDNPPRLTLFTPAYQSLGAFTKAVIAASILILMGYVGFIESNAISIHNQQLTAQTIQLEGLKVVVEPGSRCEIRESIFQDSPLIEFSGAVSITAESEVSKARHFWLEQEASTHRQEFYLRKGQTFLAMTDNVFNLITATTDELNDEIPRPFSLRLIDRFHL